MNKELNALERIKKYYPFKIGELEYQNIDIVETALKNYEHLYQIWNCKDSDTMIIQTTKTIHDENNKKLKALEIIKKKGCSYMEILLIVSCKRYEEYCFEMNSDRVYENGFECERAFKTQEEYDLLKELL